MDCFIDGCAYAEKTGAIQVNIQYRKGPFGFLAHPATWGESNTTGNWGILDQLLALQWVKENIAYFGGDPNQVLINGHSGGAQFVDFLMVAPGAQGLFQAAISQSPPCVRQLTLDEAYRLTRYFIPRVGCSSAANDSAAEMDCLRAQPYEVLFTAAEALVTDVGAGYLGLAYAMCESLQWHSTFQAVVDGVVLPEHVVEAYRKGKFIDVPYMTGYTSNEGNFFVLDFEEVDEKSMHSLLKTVYPGVEYTGIIDMYPLYYYANTANPFRSQLGDLWTDLFFKCPMYERLEAREAAKPSSSSYLYEWSVTPTCLPGVQYLGAYHDVDLMYTMGITDHISPPDGDCSYTVKEDIVANHTLVAWTSMASKHVPMFANGDVWVTWSSQTQMGTFLSVDYTGPQKLDVAKRCSSLQALRTLASEYQKAQLIPNITTS
eukprot:TRINITY_DN3034_c0_g2_i3.p1 TRINITY_DN3034_c0_g2~~TRINITY_DN3034_c0_g2_i3.p1  ORF type:complete len:488 (+),score=36.87 TRINITY_DN3034_c0_g2_i3:172-1464(+)